MENTLPTNKLIERLTGSLSPEGREILERVEALAPVAETDPASPEAVAALIESLPGADRAAIYRIMGLKASAYQRQGKEYAEEARFASQAVGLIDHALDLERVAGREPDEGMTLGEALEILKPHGKELPDLDAQRVVAVPQEGERTVPAFYPDFTNAGQWRRRDGSEQAEAWAQLVESREAAILASVGELAGADVAGIDYAGVIAALWKLDEDEAAEFVRRAPSALRGTSGDTMTIPGGASTPQPKALSHPPCSAHRLLSWGRSFQSTWLRPFALPRPDALSPPPSAYRARSS